MDFLKKFKKIGEESEAEARKKYGEDYEKAGTLGRGVMRGISSGVLGEGASSPFSFEPGSPGSEMDLKSFVSIKPMMPQGANPMQLYGNLYGAYGGRKMRGLLFD